MGQENCKLFIRRVPTADIHSSLESILNLYTSKENMKAIIITENGQYVKLLTSKLIIQIINERKVADALDKNPLSGLPSNLLIQKNIDAYREKISQGIAFVYFDFNNCKPFNDSFGFRFGDWVIRFFADLIDDYNKKKRWFTGHIGGDNFFMGVAVKHGNLEELLNIIKSIESLAKLWRYLK